MRVTSQLFTIASNVRNVKEVSSENIKWLNEDSSASMGIVLSYR